VTRRRRRLRVLVTARDVGAARQARAVIEGCRRLRAAIDFVVVAQAPAITVFRGLSAPVVRVSRAGRGIPEWMEQARPDFLLAGLSGFGRGVDEQALSAARRLGIPSGAVQDYWGYLGPEEHEDRPDTFFVMDATAAALTRARCRTAKVVVAGSPKHEQYRERWQQWMPVRRAKRPQVVFFMQPRAVPGLSANLEAFLRASTALSPGIDVRVRLHPAEPTRPVVARLADRIGARVTVEDSKGPVEKVLGAAALVVTCFSTVGLDHTFLQLYARRSLGALLYLNIGAPIRAFMSARIGCDRVPGADVGLGVTRTTASGLADWMADAIEGPDQRRAFRTAVTTHFRSARSPARRIAAFFQNEWASL